MSTKYENFTTDSNAASTITTTTRLEGQTFTPSISHNITSVKLELKKSSGATGTATISIRAVAGTPPNELPTGGDLCSGTIALSGITQSKVWYEITFSSSTTLTAGIKYAIVIGVPDISGTFYIYANTAGGYAGGGDVYYLTSWATNEPVDLVFEEWGDPLSTYVDVTGSIDIVSGLSGTPTIIIQVSGTIIIVSGLSGRLSSNSIRWVQPRPSLYESDVFWDEDTKTWTGTDGNSGGRYKSNLIVVGQTSTGTGCLYYGEI
jgi:hypothetical protein